MGPEIAPTPGVNSRNASAVLSTPDLASPTLAVATTRGSVSRPSSPAYLPLYTAMFKLFSLEASNQRTVALSMLVDPGADKHYVSPDLLPDIKQHPEERYH